MHSLRRLGNARCLSTIPSIYPIPIRSHNFLPPYRNRRRTPLFRSLGVERDRVGGVKTKDDNEPQDYTIRQKMKRIMKRYGAVGFGVYASVYVSFWSAFYVGFANDLIDTSFILGSSGSIHEYVSETLDALTWTENYRDIIKNTPQLTTAAVALLACKIIEPVRWGVTIAITPTVSKMIHDYRKEGRERGGWGGRR
ncbi:hypothetical protein TrLO_g13495 [Triparma laevis f. longispina]|uniref:DUF1279 domain-containing protein n=1 Tax=Triparma laevis f. longispina TaxID=1714387 RepID=A0A9W7KZN4_9STRA|nr:hypothetical protein TrLO_g13495 [Triparma laevis f. longispina]